MPQGIYKRKWKRKLSEETKKKISKANKGKKHSEKAKKKISEGNVNRYIKNPNLKKQISEKLKGIKKLPFTEEHKRNLSEALKGKKKSLFSEEHKRNIGKGRLGKIMSEETKQKIRISSFEYAKKVAGILCPRIGRNEIKTLDELEQELGYRIIRQYKVGGYHLDGYIPEINLAIEIDEKYHKIQEEKDIKREEFIKVKLGCEFLRIKDHN